MKPQDLRKALRARQATAPHLADGFPVYRNKPDSGDLRRAAAALPLTEFNLGPCSYSIRECWEVLDLMVRNISGGGEGRKLRPDAKRWKARQDEHEKALAASAAARNPETPFVI